MLIVTERAAEYLKEALTRKEEGAPDALRIVYADDGYQLTLDDPKEGDQVFEREGDHYLVVDSQVGQALAEATLDVQESPQGLRLMLSAALPPGSEGDAPSPERPAPSPEA